MDRKKTRPTPRSKMERIGVETGILDCNRNEIASGDIIRLKGTGYVGPVLWHRDEKCFGIFMGLWYGDMNPMNPDCYGKFIPIPKDNGMRMELEPMDYQVANNS